MTAEAAIDGCIAAADRESANLGVPLNTNNFSITAYTSHFYLRRYNNLYAAAGIILAGGKSTRMGINKALLPLGKGSLLETIVAVMSPLFAEIIIVSNSPESYREFNVRLVKDIIPDRGPLSGIHAGLLASSYRYNFIVPCDTPFLNPDLIGYFLDRAPGYDVVVPRLGEYLQPLHAVYSRDCLTAIEDCFRQGIYKVVAFYPRTKVRYIDVAELEGFSGLDRIFFNVNTPADLIKAQRLAGKPDAAASILTLEKARKLLLEGLEPRSADEVKLEDGAGRVLAVPVVAPEPYPPFPRSRVDGYALGPPPRPGNGQAGTGTAGYCYRVLGSIPAGSNREFNLEAGMAAAIFTGAPIPAGTVTVIPGEMVFRRGQFINVPHLPAKKYIEAVAAEVAAGEQVLAAGTLLNAATIGLLAALGRWQVPVFSRPRVVLAANGSELCDSDGSLPPGPYIYNSNLYALAAAIKADGGEVISLGILPDDLEQQATAYRDALEQGDLIVTSGGAGGSTYDLTAAAFSRAGGEGLFTRINIRPGRRVIAARAGKKLMLGLPGNPPAAMAAYYLLAAPIIRVLGGREAADKTVTARLAAALDRTRTERFFIWARTKFYGNGWQVTPLPRKPGGICAAAGANSLIDLPPGAAPAVGDEVQVVLLDTIHR